MKTITILMLAMLTVACGVSKQRNPDYWNCVDASVKAYNSCMVNATTGEDVQACQTKRTESIQVCTEKYPAYQ